MKVYEFEFEHLKYNHLIFKQINFKHTQTKTNTHTITRVEDILFWLWSNKAKSRNFNYFTTYTRAQAQGLQNCFGRCKI